MIVVHWEMITVHWGVKAEHFKDEYSYKLMIDKTCNNDY